LKQALAAIRVDDTGSSQEIEEGVVVDTAYISVVAALAGSTIGGLTSLMASWVTQHVQFNAQVRASQMSRREELYKNFIEEASRWYADAYEHDAPKVSNLVGLYAMVSRMRILSTPKVIENANKVVHVIVETYHAPNKTFNDVTELRDDKVIDPLKSFSIACREELWGRAR
jgi:hypothetical protein